MSLSPPRSDEVVKITTNLYANRTVFYLAPIINAMSTQLSRRINFNSAIAWGINDLVYLEHKEKHHYAIFILFRPLGHSPFHADRQRSTQGFQQFLRWVRQQTFFIDDYIYNLRGERLHMVTLKVNRTWKKAYNQFLDGHFSQMYSRRDLHKVQIRPMTRLGKRNAVYEVLTKAERYHEVFEEEVNTLFASNVMMEKGVEYDAHELTRMFEVFNSDQPGINHQKSR